jgi:hypothetical protein
VTYYVREQKRRTKEVFVPLSHRPGHAQVDFGETLGVIGGVECRDLFDTQNTRQPAWLRPELHVALHILTVAGRAEQKPQRHDPRVERWWRHLRIGHVKLICAQLVRRRRIRRPLQKSSKVLDCPNVGFLRLVTHPVDTHVFHHPLT